jgi:hypothetical protein
VQGTRALQAGHDTIMADRMDQAVALRKDEKTTEAYYGGEQVK